MLVDQYAFDITDGGAGKFRGGRGLIRDYRILADDAQHTGTFGRFKFLPWGMAGGESRLAQLHEDHLRRRPRAARDRQDRAYCR